VVGFINPGTAEAAARWTAAFRKGLNDAGYIEGQNVVVDYHWLGGQYDRLPMVLADFVSRPVAVIATPGFQAASLAAKAATATIPIVFGVAEDPVQLGLVASLARPGGNATGVNTYIQEIGAKRLRLLHELVPGAGRVAVLVNPANRSAAATTLRDVNAAAPIIGVQIHVFNATTISEIAAAFASVGREQLDAVFVGPDGFFSSRAAQFATAAASYRIPASYSNRDYVAAGGLMSYGTDNAETYHQVGVYTGSVLNGAKPTDLPVRQLTKFEFVINAQTARTLGIDIPSGLIAVADEVID